MGWLSEQLHEYYGRAIQGERIAVIGQVAITIRHEVNNALATIMAEGQMLEQHGGVTNPEDLESLHNMMLMTRRIRDSVDMLTNLTQSPTTEYVAGVKMIDLAKLSGPDAAEEDVAQRRDKRGGRDRQ